MKVLLLLSGGKDSAEALKRLLAGGHEVECLCIDGKQGKEKIGAKTTAAKHGVEIHIVKIDQFDEDTWNPLKLWVRNVYTIKATIRLAKKLEVDAVATGVKKADCLNWKLFWLAFYMIFCKIAANHMGYEFLFPVWD